MSNKTFFPLILLALAGICLYGFFHPRTFELHHYDKQEVIVTGTVRDRIDERFEKSYAEIDNIIISDRPILNPSRGEGLPEAPLPSERGLGDRPVRIPKSETLRITLPRIHSLSRGDIITFSGTIKLPESFETDAKTTFNYPGYLASQNIGATMDRVEILQVTPKKTPIENLDHLFYFCRTQIRKYVPFPASSLIAGVLLGDQSGFSKNMLQEFRSAGLSHVIVLSGFNVTLVANSVYNLFSKRKKISEEKNSNQNNKFKNVFGGKNFALVSSFLILGLFLLFVGPTLALMRAALMTSCTLLVKHYRLGNHMMRALLLAALIIGIINPYTLLYDISFHLSFLATFGLIAFGTMFSRLIETRFSWIPEKFELRETLSSTFAAQLGVLPIMMFQMGSVPLISPLINLIVVPLVPYLMILGALIILTCWLPLVPWIFGIASWIISSFVFFVAHLSLWGPVASFVVRK